MLTAYPLGARLATPPGRQVAIDLWCGRLGCACSATIAAQKGVVRPGFSGCWTCTAACLRWTGDNPAVLSAWIGAPSADAIFFEQAVKAAAVDAQRARGAGLVAFFAQEHFDDVCPLNLFQLVAVAVGRVLAFDRAAHLGAQVLPAHRCNLGENLGPLNYVHQLPDVAGPGISLQCLHGPLFDLPRWPQELFDQDRHVAGPL